MKRFTNGFGVFGVIAAGFVACATLGSAALAQSGEPDPDGVITDEQRQKIEEAIPKEPVVEPEEPRKLLIFDVNVVYGGHPSRFHANLAFQRMGEETGAFETVISRDPEMFRPEKLQEFDAVFLNNTVGNLFTDPELRQSLDDFIKNGGGLLGCHGTTVAFYRWGEGGIDWPQFHTIIGGQGADHREPQEKAYLKIDSPDHPLTDPFPDEGFTYHDEFYRVSGPYSRETNRVLFSIDVDKTELDLEKKPHEREDKDYAVAWVKSYGEGRVAYCSIGHNPYVFWDPQMLEFYLGMTQFVLGDLEASTTPSAQVESASASSE